MAKQPKNSMSIDLGSEPKDIKTFFAGKAASSSSAAAPIPDGRAMMRRASGTEEGLGLMAPPFSPKKAEPEDAEKVKANFKRKREKDEDEEDEDYRPSEDEEEKSSKKAPAAKKPKIACFSDTLKAERTRLATAKRVLTAAIDLLSDSTIKRDDSKAGWAKVLTDIGSDAHLHPVDSSSVNEVRNLTKSFNLGSDQSLVLLHYVGTYLLATYNIVQSKRRIEEHRVIVEELEKKVREMETRREEDKVEW